MRACSVSSFGFAFFAASAMLQSTGCGRSDRGSVSGTLVHKDGSPVAMARVVAHAKDTGATAYGTTDKDGYFKISEGLAPGDYDVNILEDRGGPDDRRPAKIASKYRDPAKSGLSVSVQGGSDVTLNLSLDPP